MTPKQKRLLDLIKAEINRTGVVPSYQEMADATGLKSKSGVHRVIVALEQAGEISRLPGRARQISLPGAIKARAPVHRDRLLKLSADLRAYRKTRREVCDELREVAWQL